MLKIIPFLLAFLLTACASGPGGNTISSPSYSVPFHTPVRVGSVSITQSVTSSIAVADIFTKDLTGSGVENVIIAGRSVDTTRIDSQINIFGWQSGQLVNQTSSWFSGNDNIIRGTEPDIEFGDFLGNGKIGMYVPPSTDSESIRGAPGSVFINNGNSFTRVDLNLGSTWAHDSVVRDFDRDGRADIFTLDYGPNSSLSLSNGDGTFSIFRNTSGVLQGASGVAAADFMGNGTVSLIVTDSSTTLGQQNSLMSWSLSGSDLVMTTQSFLPVGRFDLPKWASYKNGLDIASHNVRALAFDFDNSGVPSAVIFSTPTFFIGAARPAWSEVQFLKNNGSGVFTDVTDSVLVGYDNTMPVSYNPKLIDINGDGLTDIFLSAAAWVNPTNNTQVLLHTADHKFVASYANVFAAFENQSYNLEAIRSAAISNLNVTNIVQGPNNELYLITLINTVENGAAIKAIYLSKIGAMTTTAQATLAAIRTNWPYLSDAQANSILSKTSTTWLGFRIVDPVRALSPIGNLGLNINGRRTAFSGYISGLKLKDRNTVLFDDVGRSFAVDLSSTSALSPNAWARYSENIIDDTRGAQSMKLQYMQAGNFKFGADTATQSLAVGLTGVQIGKNSQLSFQYTQMPFSPFIQMSGSWGSVKKSSMLESTVTAKYQGFVGRVGLMYANTTIDAGLVTDISAITSVWSEVGYEWKHAKLMGGMLPKVVNGTASLRLPVGVDMSGVSLYNDSKVNISNPTTSYVRLAYQEQVSKAVSFSFNGLVSDRKQTSLMSEMKIKF